MQYNMSLETFTKIVEGINKSQTTKNPEKVEIYVVVKKDVFAVKLPKIVPVHKRRAKRSTPGRVLSKEARNARRKQCIEYKGGKCQYCGYDKYLPCLELHHPKGRTEEEANGRQIVYENNDFESVKPLLDQLELVCCNCHRAIHVKAFTSQSMV